MEEFGRRGMQVRVDSDRSPVCLLLMPDRCAVHTEKRVEDHEAGTEYLHQGGQRHFDLTFDPDRDGCLCTRDP